MAPPDIILYPRAGRSQSISSDRPSTSYGSLMSPPLLISPEPGFIAASAASQIVTNDHDSQAESWLDQHGIEPSGETALVAQPALRLVNRFLDHILFNFLSASKSTSLTALRPAVSEILKPKLAKDAINGADQELHEYLGEGDDEQIMAYHNGNEPPRGDWDLELIWKRTRLRCMVYSSLGDMEEEDEDFYTEQEHLEASTGPLSSNSGVVSPAVAIFLTSILEFVGEQVLVVAGQGAYQRLRTKYEKEARDGTSVPTEIAERVVVEDTDVERVALDRTLGRLWRGWKKRVRSPTTSISLSRSFSRESLQSQLANRTTATPPEEQMDDDIHRPSLAAVLAEYEIAAGVPLPMTDDDVREIEIPGLAAEIKDALENEVPTSQVEAPQPRPKSMVFFGQFPLTPTDDGEPVSSLPVSRKRSNSLPTPVPSPYNPSKRLKFDDSEKSEKDQVENSEEGQDEVIENTVHELQADPNSHSDNGIPGIVAGVVAAGAVAAAGIVSVVQGKAPQTEIDSTTEIDSDEEPEEAVILTARVSVGGGSPNDPVGLSRRSSIRSHSGHSSVRVIDVARTPSLSRTGSVDKRQGDRMAERVGSRPTSIQAPATSGTHSPRVSSPMTRGGSNRSSIVRNASTGNAHSSEESITEEKEAYESEGELDTAIPAELAAAMQGVDVDFSPTHQEAKVVTKQATKEPAPFKLSAVPPPRKAISKSPTKDQHNGRLQPMSDNKAPSLTPLRELMEVAPGTSDEASSLAPSYDTYSTSEYGKNGHQQASQISTKRGVEQQKPLRAINTNLPRAPTTRSGDPSRKRSTSVQKSPHQSASGSDTASQKYVATRGSEEGSIAESKGQSFEQLIRSDETIQYTLTPQTMRNIESPDSPRGTSSIKANTHEVPRPGTSRSGSSSNRKMGGLRSNPVENTNGSRSAAGANIGSKLRPNVAQPRDARIDRDSIGDFADFIRSTGPANSYEQVPIRPIQSHRGTNGTPRNFSGSVPRTASPANLPRRAESSAGRKKLQARDAVVPRGDSISDLIDFVRSGPQLDKEGQHRISRTVAPFRSTMDSDQMTGAVGGKAIDATLHEPRYSQTTSTSVQSSVTSQSGLLKNAATNKPLPTHRNDFDEPDMMPKRKTRRVRDPYAIDFSDEEEDYNPTPKAKPIKEESLADFLRNVPPPPEPVTNSVFDSVPKPPGKDIRKKSSTTSLMHRFGRRGSESPANPKPKTSSGPVLQKPRTANGPAPAVQKPKTSSGPEPRSVNSRNGVNTHAPINARFTTTTTTPHHESSPSDNYAPQVEPARSRVPRKAYQPREAVAAPISRTNDLADFLMSNEPPPRAQTQPQPFMLNSNSPKEESSTFQRMFGRKKVH